MFSQLPPETSSKNSHTESNSFFENMKRQSSLPPPVSRGTPGSTQLWTPPPTPPLPVPVNSSLAQQQQSQQKLTLQQLRRLPPSERPVEPTPSKYTGASIPSRSFRLLQLITGEDIENQYAASPSLPNPPPTTQTRPASSMAAFGRPLPVGNPAPGPESFTNQPHASYTTAAPSTSSGGHNDFGTDF